MDTIFCLFRTPGHIPSKMTRKIIYLFLSFVSFCVYLFKYYLQKFPPSFVSRTIILLPYLPVKMYSSSPSLSFKPVHFAPLSSSLRSPSFLYFLFISPIISPLLPTSEDSSWFSSRFLGSPASSRVTISPDLPPTFLPTFVGKFLEFVI
jgi:hypothetical protein